MTLTVVNFATKEFYVSQKINTFTAKYIGRADQIFNYNENTVRALGHFPTTNQSKGYGSYSWKSKIVLNALTKIRENDYLFYCDSGSLFLKPLSSLINILENSKKEIMCFSLPLIEKQWTKQNTLMAISKNPEIDKNTPQILAGYFLIKKTKETLSFFKKFENYCSDEELISDAKKDQITKDLISHRHDQSIFSLMCKNNKKTTIILTDISDYGIFPEKYYKHNPKYLFNISRVNKASGIILLFRKENPIFYGIKYLTKMTLRWLGFQ
jgi:hypothetical protein